MPDDPQFLGGISKAFSNLVRKEKQTLRGFCEDLLNISKHLQRNIDDLKPDHEWAKTNQLMQYRMLEEKVEQMLGEQNMQLKQSSALMEEQKALLEYWHSIAQHWDSKMQHWEKNMERWQRQDSAAGALGQTNTTASARRTASEAKLGGGSPVASRRQTHGGPQPEFGPTAVCHRLSGRAHMGPYGPIKLAPPAVPPPGFSADTVPYVHNCIAAAKFRLSSSRIAEPSSPLSPLSEESDDE